MAVSEAHRTGLTMLAPPVTPVAHDDVRHGRRSPCEPTGRAACEVASDRIACRAQVEIGSFPTHGFQKLHLVALFRECIELNTCAVWGETTNDPRSPNAKIGIWRPHGSLQERGALTGLRDLATDPERRGRHERLRFAGDQPTPPLGEGDKARAP